MIELFGQHPEGSLSWPPLRMTGQHWQCQPRQGCNSDASLGALGLGHPCHLCSLRQSNHDAGDA